MSNADRRNKIPAAPTFTTGGNLLSNVAPPTELPNFVMTVPTPAATAPNNPEVPQVVPVTVPVPVPVSEASQDVETKKPLPVSPESPEKFSPAIPLSKGEPTLPIRSPEDSLTTLSPESLPESISESDKLGDVMPGSGILTWMKGAVSSGGIFQRVAEKAKNSVDSMITTLDPQMKEYLKSGGDLCIVVASDKEVKVSPVREAFQAVFGKATVIGYAAHSDVTAAQPVGYAAAYAAAKQRIAYVRSVHSELTNNVPVLAVEGFIQETVTDRWYEMSLLVLSQPSLGIELQMQSQATPVPGAAVAAARAASEGYAHALTGFSVTIGSIMATNLQKSFNFDENTYKYYYSPLSPQEKSDNIVINNNTCDGGKRKSQSIEHFFEAQPKIKKRKLLSSTVARAARDGVSYISTNSDDGDQATHLIKIEMYDMKKLCKIPTTDHWKHASTRIKYYVKNNEDSIYDNTNTLVYNITKTIAESEKVKKYFFNNDSH